MSEEEPKPPKNIKKGYHRSAGKLIKKLSGPKLTRAHMSELSQALISQFHGAEGFAREVFKVYGQCDDSPTQRVRILGMIVDLVKNDTVLTGKQAALDDVNDEDLENELTELVESIEPDAEVDDEPEDA